jgi:RNA polymerase sigma-70 factor, ECF subfamily
MTDPSQPVLVEIEDVRVSRSVDHEAFVLDAFTMFHAEIYSFLRRTTRSESVADDLVQEAFLRLMKEVRAGRRPEQVRAWLYRVASNLAVSRGRRASTVVKWIREAARRTTESPETTYLSSERASMLEAALSSLGVDARAALLMSAEGFSGEEIASAIGRTHAATRTLLTRARVKVRLVLESASADR